jgi:hypothetical protein
LFEIPGFNAVRVLNRIINVELIFLAFFVAISFRVVSRMVKYKWPLFVVILTFMVADNFLYGSGLSRFKKDRAKERVDLVREKMKGLTPQTLVSYEPIISSGRKAWLQIDAMIIAQELGLKTLNVYTANVPTGYYQYAVFSSIGREVWKKKKDLKEDIVVISGINDPEIERISLKIRSSAPWLERIRKQAIERNISVDENIIKNASWIINQNQQKKTINK